MSRQTNALIRKAIKELRDAGPDKRLRILDRIRPFLKEMDFRRVSDQVSSANAADDLKRVQERKSDTEAVSVVIDQKKKREREETQTGLLLAAIFFPPSRAERLSVEMDPEDEINQGPRPLWAV